MTIAQRPASADAEQLQALLDALLYSVSHDLRSPLLTISLSAELLTDQATAPSSSAGGEGSSGTAVAIDAMRHGAEDLERLLQAVTLLSRARRRTLDAEPVRAQVLLGGLVVRSEEPNLVQRSVGVDAMVVRELLDALTGDAPAEVHGLTDGEYLALRLPAPASVSEVRGSPLAALVESLRTHAGTPVEPLAVAEVLLNRQGGALAVADGEVTVWLPLAEGQG